MGKFIFKLAKRLRAAGLLPWVIWSPVYDRFHRQVKK